MEGFIDWLLNLGAAWPDLLSLFVGILSGTALSVLFETFICPEKWPRRMRQGYTVLIAIAGSVVLSSLMWGVMDPADTGKMRWVVSTCVAIPSPFVMVWLSKVLSRYVPWINSVWSLDPPDPNDHDPVP